jgi:hypothetical protein
VTGNKWIARPRVCRRSASPIFRRIREQNSAYQRVATSREGRMGAQLLILLMMIVVALTSLVLT